MPAGVSWSRYLSFTAASFLSMAMGSQAVHLYYKPLDDLNELVEKELEEIRQQYTELAASETQKNSQHG